MNLFNTMLSWKPIIEIAILWFVIYRVMLFFEGTRALQVLRGIIIVLVAFLLTQIFQLDILDWLMTKLFGISVIAILIIFHPEIRQGLARLGQRHLFSTTLRDEDLDYMLKEIGRATETLSQLKFGALIAIEKSDPLASYLESGVLVDAKISADLIEAIFTPNNPLHDGAVIIQHGRIMAAGCLFPLSENQDLSRIYGTRHRAALGLSEETDTLVIIVSEERKDISLVYKGRLFKEMGKEELLEKIKEILKLKSDE